MTGSFHGQAAAALFVVAVARFVGLLTDRSRVPIDDPNSTSNSR